MQTNINESIYFFFKCTNDPFAILWQFIVALLLHKREKCTMFLNGVQVLFSNKDTFILIAIIDCAMCNAVVDFAIHGDTQIHAHLEKREMRRKTHLPANTKTKRHQWFEMTKWKQTKFVQYIEIKSYCT